MTISIGEGSRGGHVIGHTRSGKPIYASELRDGRVVQKLSAFDKLAAEAHAQWKYRMNNPVTNPSSVKALRALGIKAK